MHDLINVIISDQENTTEEKKKKRRKEEQCGVRMGRSQDKLLAILQPTEIQKP